MWSPALAPGGDLDTLTMNIKRKWFAAILAGAHPVEYRRMSPFWKARIEPLKAPFKLRLLNGMIRPIPEALIVVERVRRDHAAQEYQLHLGKVLQVKHWDKKKQKPK